MGSPAENTPGPVGSQRGAGRGHGSGLPPTCLLPRVQPVTSGHRSATVGSTGAGWRPCASFAGSEAIRSLTDMYFMSLYLFSSTLTSTLPCSYKLTVFQPNAEDPQHCPKARVEESSGVSACHWEPVLSGT